MEGGTEGRRDGRGKGQRDRGKEGVTEGRGDRLDRGREGGREGGEPRRIPFADAGCGMGRGGSWPCEGFVWGGSEGADESGGRTSIHNKANSTAWGQRRAMVSPRSAVAARGRSGWPNCAEGSKCAAGSTAHTQGEKFGL